MSIDNWGEVARIGMFIVGSEVVPEAEWWAMAPPGVSVHAARVTAPSPWATWNDARDGVTLTPDMERGAAQFAGMALSAVTVAHSSSSVVGGAGWDATVIACLEDRLHPTTRVTTNGLDILAALRNLQIRHPLVVFPPWFGEAAVAAGIDYFSHLGAGTPAALHADPGARWAGIARQDLYAKLMHIEQSIEHLFEQITANCPADVDGVLLAGTGVRCVGLIERLESTLGRPVVTANQASLWRTLSLAGVTTPIQGYGRLLAAPRGGDLTTS